MNLTIYYTCTVCQPGDVQVIYHPHSKKGVELMGREEFRRVINDMHSTEPPIKEPWLPFRSREDFDFAEIVQKTAMNQSHVNDLIKLIHRCQQGMGKVTFENYADWKKSWEDSSRILTEVSNTPDCIPGCSFLSRGLHSSNSMRFPTNSKTLTTGLKPGHVRCGGGSWITSKTRSLFASLNGMHGRCKGTTEQNLPRHTPNRGLDVGGGKSRYG
jgi:hypothetical protein